MSTHRKVGLIHDVTTDDKIPCQKCGTINDAKAKFFSSCGQSLLKENTMATVEVDRCIFAEGLPEWSIEPPQVVIRRKRR